MAAAQLEQFEIVDDDDRVIGLAPRRACHGNPALIHRVAHVLVFNRHGQLLLQKRAETKDVQPGKWDTSVGGHLDPGETYLQGAVREMSEELGLRDLPLTFLYYSRVRNDFESENVATFFARHDGPFRYAACEIDEIRFWERDEIEAALGSGLLTPNFEDEWRLWNEWERRYPERSGATLAFCAGDTIPNLVTTLTRDEP